MSAGMVFTVGYLSLYIDFPEKVILGKHIFDIMVYLADRIDISHAFSSGTSAAFSSVSAAFSSFFSSFSDAIFPRTPFTKEPEASPPNLLASSTASLMATPVGTSSS